MTDTSSMPKTASWPRGLSICTLIWSQLWRYLWPKVLFVWINPPMINVWPSAMTTEVSASRLMMIGEPVGGCGPPMSFTSCLMSSATVRFSPILGVTVRTIPAFWDYNRDEWVTEPMEWNGETDMPPALWHRQLARQRGITVAEARALNLLAPKGKPRKASPHLFLKAGGEWVELELTG